MKTETLKEKGLTEEQINFVMAENGKDIEKYKSLSETQKTELAEAKKQLAEANKQIDEFKGMDIESIKKSAEDYKQKFEQAQKDSDAKIKEMQYDADLSKYIESLEMNDEVHAENLKKMIKEKKLPFEEGKLIGGDDIVNIYKEKYPSVFKKEEEIPNISASTPGSNQNIISGDPDKMDFETYKKWREQNK